jgi:peroxiredoxin
VTFFISKEGKILHVEKKVKTKDHGKQIIDKLKELKVEPAPKKK